MKIELFAYERAHLDGVVSLCAAEGWPTIPGDPERGHRALTNPGVTTVVALGKGEVVGFATMLSDGEIQAFLSNIAVRASARRHGVGTRLIEEAFRRAGGDRVDLLSSADEFYGALPHQRWNGFRLYPGTAGE